MKSGPKRPTSKAVARRLTYARVHLPGDPVDEPSGPPIVHQGPNRVQRRHPLDWRMYEGRHRSFTPQRGA